MLFPTFQHAGKTPAVVEYHQFLKEDENMIRTMFGPTYERLVALKDVYDPENLFRVNYPPLPRSPQTGLAR